MIALKIAEVKDFMNKLLCQDVFDHFLIQEAIITTNVSCHIDGTLQKDFYTLEELEEQNLTGLSFVPYGLLRSSCFNLIKGKKTPSYFKFSLLLSPENLKRTLSQTGSSFTEQNHFNRPGPRYLTTPRRPASNSGRPIPLPTAISPCPAFT